MLIGPHGFGNTQQYERELAVFRQSRDPTFPVVPVLLPDTPDPPFTFLQVITWIDFSHVARVLDAPLELERLLMAVRGSTISGKRPEMRSAHTGASSPSEKRMLILLRPRRCDP